MPKRSHTFQRLVLLLHQQLDDKAVVTESKLLQDQRTGAPREVDVVIEGRSGGYPVTIGIECVDTARKATVQWVEQMWAKHQDLHTDKLVLVSRLGFARTALAKAKELGLVTLSLDDATDADWTQIAGKLDTIYIDVVESRWHVYAVVHPSEGVEQARPIGRDVSLHREDRSLTATVGSVVDSIVRSPEVGKVILEHMYNRQLKDGRYTVEFRFQEPVFALDENGAEHQIRRLRIAFESVRTQTAVDLVSGSLLGAHVAYGEAASETGPVRVTIVEQQGRDVTAEISKKTGSQWLPLVNTEQADSHEGV